MEDYEKCLNFITFLCSDFLDENDISEHEFMKGWYFTRTRNLSPDKYLNLIQNCYKHSIKTFDSAINDNLLLLFYNNEIELDLCIFDTFCITANLIIEKIRLNYDITFFDKNFISKYSTIFTLIYPNENIETPKYVVGDIPITNDSSVLLYSVIVNPEQYRDLDENSRFCYNISTEKNECNKNVGHEIYNIIMNNNFNLIYLYEYFENLNIFENFEF